MRPSIRFGVIAAVLGMQSFAAPVTAFGQESLAGFSAMSPQIRSDELVRAADVALRGERLIEARALLDTLSDMPLDAGLRDDVAQLKAELLVATGRPDEARELLQSVGADVRERCRAVAALAMADIQSRDFVSADTQLRASAGRCDQDPVYWRALGQVSLGMNQPVAAVGALRQALVLDPENPGVQNDLAVTLLANGNAEEAHKLLEAIFRHSPAREDVAINLDYAGAMLGRIPRRRTDDNDALWSRRLQFAGAGARHAGRSGLAEALYARALMENPRHDEQLWQQYSEAVQQR